MAQEVEGSIGQVHSRTRWRSQPPGLGHATDAEITVAPAPASTAARTASLDGNSNITRSRPPRPRRCSSASNTDRVPEPGSRSTQFRLRQLGGGDTALHRPGMIRSHDEQHLVTGPLLVQQQRVVHRPLHEPEFGASIVHRRGDLRGVPDRKPQIDARVGLAERDEWRGSQ